MTILLTIAVIATLTLTLAGGVLLARRLLIPQIDVDVSVNDTNALRVPVGGKLLEALAQQGIRLPSACGGRGSCGQCRVLVTQGGGDPLVPELGQLTRQELAQHTRLACMVTVYEDLAVQVPETVFSAKRWACRVVSNASVSAFMTELVLKLEDGSDFSFVPGSYVLLEAPAGRTRFADFDVGPAYRSEWQRNNLLALEVERPEPVVRAYSLANYPQEAGVIKLVIRIALPPPQASAGVPPGQVSSFAYSLKPGDAVQVSGPYGDFRVSNADCDRVFIGGGAGIAPLRSMIFDELLCKGTTQRLYFFYGARSLQDLCYQDEFDALATDFENFNWQIALSEPKADGSWEGATGFIHTLVQREFLDRYAAPETAEYYICGPPIMSRSVTALLQDYGVAKDRIRLDDFGD